MDTVSYRSALVSMVILSAGLAALTLPLAAQETQIAISPESGASAQGSTILETLPADLRTQTAGEDWPSFLGPRRDSASIEKGILTAWPEDGPAIKWQTDVGSGYGSCSTSRGRCFFFDRVDDQARLRCFHAETGELLWTYAYRMNYSDAFGFDNGPRTSPVVDGDRVYVFGVEGQLHCVSVTAGKRRWMVDTSDEFGVVQNFFGVGSTPLVHGDLLLTMIGGSPDDEQGIPVMELDRVTPNGTAIVAFDKRTGRIVYSALDDLASYSSIRTAKLAGKTLALVFARGNFLVFDVDDGTEMFRFPWRAKKLESVNAASPVLAGDRVLITESYGPGCCQFILSADANPQVAWRDPPGSRKKIMASHWMTPVVHAGWMYGCTDSPRKELRCIEWTTGEIAWSEPLSSRASLLYVDGHLVMLEETGVMRLIVASPQAFREVAKCYLELGRQVWSAPVLSHGLMYVRGSDKLVCLELIPPK